MENDNFILNQLLFKILSEYSIMTKLSIKSAIKKLKSDIVYFSQNRFLENEFIFYKVCVCGCFLTNIEILEKLKFMEGDYIELDKTLNSITEIYSTLSIPFNSK